MSTVMRKYPGSNSRKSNRKTNMLIREVIDEGNEDEEEDDDEEEAEEDEDDAFQQYKKNLETARKDQTRNPHYQQNYDNLTEEMLARARGDKLE